ncbi:origin of replication complex subunit 3 [Panicum miliaceum]|uniref:Origin of replication complex subunit 3 n=1 Tax=Panicum miliaceum TaxID=4540 RepID=A0A3L6SFW1_PANMI|nr:origin of replication complex subunit 3 [Panicum miliaceum]
MAAHPGDAPLTAANNIQPFFVLHKAAAAAASSVPSSRTRRRIDASLPSSPNPKSAKRPRDVDAQDEEDSELYEQLHLEAFHRIWSRIQSTIDEVLRGINLKLFDQVLQWAQESFSAIRAVAKPCHDEVRQPYPLLTDVICRRIPTAFVLTKNAEFVDDITTFRDLAGHLQSSGCHLAKLSAAELSVKHGVGGCFRSLLRQLLSDVPDVADVSALASWYCEAENYDQPIIVIIDDLEQCSGDVLGELVMMLSEWVIKIPIFFVMGIATTLDAPKKLLSSEALQQLEPCKLTLGSPSDRMNALVEATLVKPCAGFCISHECLYEAGRHDKVQLLDIFCEAVNPDLQTQNVSNAEPPVSKLNIEKLSGMKSGSGKVYMAQVMNAIRRSTGSTGNGTAPLNEKVALLLQDITRKYLVPVECLPFHEIICFKNVGVLQSVQSSPRIW